MSLNCELPCFLLPKGAVYKTPQRAAEHPRKSPVAESVYDLIDDNYLIPSGATSERSSMFYSDTLPPDIPPKDALTQRKRISRVS